MGGSATCLYSSLGFFLPKTAPPCTSKGLHQVIPWCSALHRLHAANMASADFCRAVGWPGGFPSSLSNMRVHHFSLPR